MYNLIIIFFMVTYLDQRWLFFLNVLFGALTKVRLNHNPHCRQLRGVADYRFFTRSIGSQIMICHDYDNLWNIKNSKIPCVRKICENKKVLPS
jgi:hypothetical protein